MARALNLTPHPSIRMLSRQSARPLLLAFVLFYLGFHAVSGDRGVLAWLRESRKLEATKVELAQLSAQRAALEHKTKLLSSGSLDLDMLDERARAVLGLVGKDEVIYLP